LSTPFVFLFQVTVSKVWAFLAAIFIIIAPLANEIWDIYKTFFRNNRMKTFPEDLHNENANTSSVCEPTDEDAGKGVTGDKRTDVEGVHLSAFTPFKSRESDAGIIGQNIQTKSD
jgi:hypothetical protein